MIEVGEAQRERRPAPAAGRTRAITSNAGATKRPGCRPELHRAASLRASIQRRFSRIGPRVRSSSAVACVDRHSLPCTTRSRDELHLVRDAFPLRHLRRSARRAPAARERRAHVHRRRALASFQACAAAAGCRSARGSAAARQARTRYSISFHAGILRAAPSGRPQGWSRRRSTRPDPPAPAAARSSSRLHAPAADGA